MVVRMMMSRMMTRMVVMMMMVMMMMSRMSRMMGRIRGAVEEYWWAPLVTKLTYLSDASDRESSTFFWLREFNFFLDRESSTFFLTERVQLFFTARVRLFFWQRELPLQEIKTCVSDLPPHSKHLCLQNIILPAIRKKAMQFSKTVNPFPQLISVLFSLGFCLQLKWFLHQFSEHSLLSSSLSIFLRSLCALWMGGDTWCCAISIRHHCHLHHMLSNTNIELHFKELDNSASYWYWSYQYQPTSTTTSIIGSPIQTLSYIPIQWATFQRTSTGTGAISISPPAPAPPSSYALQYGELHLKTLSCISIHRATSQCIELHFNTLSYISKNRITVHRTGSGHH